MMYLAFMATLVLPIIWVYEDVKRDIGVNDVVMCGACTIFVGGMTFVFWCVNILFALLQGVIV